MLRKKLLRHQHTAMIPLACILLAVLFISYLLISDTFFPLSITTIWHAASHYVTTPELEFLTAGVLPFYVAIMVFGAAFFGVISGYAVLALLRYVTIAFFRE